jgi:hypothetical protein
MTSSGSAGDPRLLGGPVNRETILDGIPVAEAKLTGKPCDG